MGTGKTTIATKLAHRLKMRYISTDTVIEERQKKTINDLHQRRKGLFRDAESKIIEEVGAMENMVIDTGGGAVIRDENIVRLKTRHTLLPFRDAADIIERTKSISTGRFSTAGSEAENRRSY